MMVECEGRGQGEAGAGLGLGEHDEAGGGELVLQAAEPRQGGGDGESVTLHRDLHLAEKSSPSVKSNIVSLLFSHKQLSSPWLRWLDDTQDTD